MALHSPQAVPDGATLDVDVCIVGGGVVGLMLARELAAGSHRVCVLESGSYREDATARARGIGRVVGAAYHQLGATRERRLGGTAHLWRDGRLQLRRLDPVDFRRRDGIPHSGWPFGIDELRPFYERVESRLGVRSPDLQRSLLREQVQQQLPTAWAGAFADGVELGFLHDGDASTVVAALESLQASSRVHVYPNATAARLSVAEGRASVVEVGRAGGDGFTVRASTTVLAAGGIENARLLLVSRLGGQATGRYFMEHALIPGKLIEPARGGVRELGAFDVQRHADLEVRPHLTLAASLLEDRSLGNLAAVIAPRLSQRRHRGVRAAMRLRDGHRSASDVRAMLAGLDQVLYGGVWQRWRGAPPLPDVRSSGWSRWPAHVHGFRAGQLWYFGEQLPDPGNRVVLSEQVDDLGHRVADLHFQWGRETEARLQRGIDMLERRLLRTGAVRLAPNGDHEGPSAWGLHHHMGTTRMHRDPRWGVVDADCRVHGTENLYVAGTSVFPTGGFANPTLTGLALTLRLASHLAATGGNRGVR